MSIQSIGAKVLQPKVLTAAGAGAVGVGATLLADRSLMPATESLRHEGHGHSNLSKGEATALILGSGAAAVGIGITAQKLAGRSTAAPIAAIGKMAALGGVALLAGYGVAKVGQFVNFIVFSGQH